MTQMQSFVNEHTALISDKPLPNNSKLLKLCPKLDDANVMRCHGRLQYAEYLSWDWRFPIILPKDCWVTTVIVKFYHEKVGHHGTNHTLAAVSSRFWILCAREAIKKWQSTCALCGKNICKSCSRLCRTIYYHSRMWKTYRQKRYLCLFTCTESRAVHLKLAFGLDTSCFLNALFRMTNGRGMPVEVGYYRIMQEILLLLKKS